MSFQFYQVSLLIPAVLFCLVAWKVKPMKLKIALLLAMALLALFNPVRFKQEGGGSLERFVSSEQEIKDRVVVDGDDFASKQRTEMKLLKKESVEVRNEEIN